MASAAENTGPGAFEPRTIAAARCSLDWLPCEKAIEEMSPPDPSDQRGQTDDLVDNARSRGGYRPSLCWNVLCSIWNNKKMQIRFFVSLERLMVVQCTQDSASGLNIYFILKHRLNWNTICVSLYRNQDTATTVLFLAYGIEKKKTADEQVRNRRPHWSSC